MASCNGRAAEIKGLEEAHRVYRICLFDCGAVVPAVELFSAQNDEQAVAFARSINPSAEREVWDWHRLVAHLPAAPEGVSV
jgi:hypothetical protein